MSTENPKSGELTLKQAGIMLLVCSVVIGGADFATAGGHWEWGGIPVIYVAGLFAIGGVILAIIGFVKKA